MAGAVKIVVIMVLYLFGIKPPEKARQFALWPCYEGVLVLLGNQYFDFQNILVGSGCHMANFMEKITSIREAAEKEVLELIEIISDNERLHNEFPTMKRVFIDVFRQLELEVLKIQPTNQKQFWDKNYLASILQDLQGAIKGLYICISTTSNFHDSPKEKSLFYKATIRNSLKRFDYIFEQLEKQPYHPVLDEDEIDLFEEEGEEEAEEYEIDLDDLLLKEDIFDEIFNQ